MLALPLAFQFGDGLSNIIIPTNGGLLAMLNLASVPFSQWLRFIFPLFTALTVLGIFFLVASLNLGYV